MIKSPNKFQFISRLFNLVSLFPSKYHYKIVKKKLFISIKHDLIIGRDMPGTRRRKILIKKLGLVKKMVVIFPHSGFKKMI